MPYKSDKLSINNEKLDKRVKLTEENKKAIVREYETGTISITSLAKKYSVSKRLIQFTLFPERKEKARQSFLERRKDGRYYDKDKHNEHMKKHRQHKNDLLKKGLIGEGE